MSAMQSATLLDLLQARSRGDGAHRGYTFLADGEHESAWLSYADLDARARSLAASLHERIAPRSCIVLAYPPGLEFIAAFFAALYAGLVAVPACLPHPRKGGARLAAIAADCAAEHVLTTTPGARLLAAAARHVPALEALEITTTDSEPHSPSGAAPYARAESDTVAFLQYTSGSTRSPRGVQVSHANVLANLAAIHAAERNDVASRGVCWLPAYHDMGLIEGILQPLYGDFATWLMPHAAFLQRPVRWLHAISRYRASVSGGPNFAYDACVRRVGDADITGVDLSCWQVAYCGAEPVRAKTLDAFAARFEPLGLRRSALRPVYGLAESTLLVTASEHTADTVRVRHADKRALERGLYVAAAEPAEAMSLVSCGVPAAGVGLAILEPTTLSPVAVNHIGEIWVSGPSVAAGYYKKASNGRDPFVDASIAGVQARWLCTGDLGIMIEGELYVTGRSKDIIILRGRKLHPQDIEHTVEQLRSPQISGVAAFTVDEAAAEGVVLLAELCGGDRIEPRTEQAYQAYADMIRAEVYREHEVALASLAFLPPGALARTSSGKLMRFRCKQDFVNAQLPLIARFDAPSHDAGSA